MSLDASHYCALCKRFTNNSHLVLVVNLVAGHLSDHDRPYAGNLMDLGDLHDKRFIALHRGDYT